MLASARTTLTSIRACHFHLLLPGRGSYNYVGVRAAAHLDNLG